MNVNKNDNLYIKINYIREEISIHLVKKSFSNNENGAQSQNYQESDHQFSEENNNKPNETLENNYFQIQNLKNEKIIDEEDLLKSKFIYNKSFVKE